MSSGLSAAQFAASTALSEGPGIATITVPCQSCHGGSTTFVAPIGAVASVHEAGASGGLSAAQSAASVALSEGPDVTTMTAPCQSCNGGSTVFVAPTSAVASALEAGASSGLSAAKSAASVALSEGPEVTSITAYCQSCQGESTVFVAPTSAVSSMQEVAALSALIAARSAMSLVMSVAALEPSSTTTITIPCKLCAGGSTAFAVPTNAASSIQQVGVSSGAEAAQSAASAAFSQSVETVTVSIPCPNYSAGITGVVAPASAASSVQTIAASVALSVAQSAAAKALSQAAPASLPFPGFATPTAGFTGHPTGFMGPSAGSRGISAGFAMPSAGFAMSTGGFAMASGSIATPIGGSAILSAGVSVFPTSFMSTASLNTTLMLPSTPCPTCSSIFTVVDHNVTEASSRTRIAGTTVSAGGAGVTILGTPVSYVSSNSLAIKSTTTGPTTPSPLAYTVAGHTVTVTSSCVIIVGSTVTAGGPGITVSGTAISMAPSGDLIIGQKTVPLQSTGSHSAISTAIAGAEFTLAPRSLQDENAGENALASQASNDTESRIPITTRENGAEGAKNTSTTGDFQSTSTESAPCSSCSAESSHEIAAASTQSRPSVGLSQSMSATASPAAFATGTASFNAPVTSSSAAFQNSTTQATATSVPGLRNSSFHNPVVETNATSSYGSSAAFMPGFNATSASGSTTLFVPGSTAVSASGFNNASIQTAGSTTGSEAIVTSAPVSISSKFEFQSAGSQTGSEASATPESESSFSNSNSQTGSEASATPESESSFSNSGSQSASYQTNSEASIASASNTGSNAGSEASATSISGFNSQSEATATSYSSSSAESKASAVSMPKASNASSSSISTGIKSNVGGVSGSSVSGAISATGVFTSSPAAFTGGAASTFQIPAYACSFLAIMTFFF